MRYRNTLRTTVLALIIGAGTYHANHGFGDGGISGSGWMRATLQRFASIVLSDTELQTNATQVLINDVPATTDALRVGQNLIVSASAGVEPSADSVHYYSTAIGQVTGVDVQNETVTVLGQQVRTYTGTHFDNTDFAALRRGVWVEVSGTRDGEDTVLATYVRILDAPPAEVRLTGVVDNVNGVNAEVAGLQVDMSTLSAPLPVEGEEISVAGVLTNPPGQGEALLASSFARLALPDLTADHIHIDGFITWQPPYAIIQGTRVEITPTTQFVNGTQANLRTGVRINAGGHASGSDLVAESVVFLPDVDLQVEGAFTDIHLLPLGAARISIAGFNVTFTQGSQFGRSNKPESNLQALTDISSGDYLKARTFVDGAGVAVQRLDRIKARDRARIDGLVGAVTATGILVQDREITPNANTRLYLGAEPVSISTFLAAAQPGDLIDAEWENAAATGAPEKLVLIPR